MEETDLSVNFFIGRVISSLDKVLGDLDRARVEIAQQRSKLRQVYNSSCYDPKVIKAEMPLIALTMYLAQERLEACIAQYGKVAKTLGEV